MSLDPKSTSNLRGQDLNCQLVLATLVTHYWRHGAFLNGGGILENMNRISRIPGALIHGRLDISSPLETAWELHRRWPGSTLHVLNDEGHGGPRMVEEIDRAVARFSADHRAAGGNCDSLP
jgi:proline iminopeptidase